MQDDPELVKVIFDRYKHEIESWHQLLLNLRIENNQLKNRLSELLKNDINCLFVDQAEFFLNKFILQDETLNIMRHDIYDHEKHHFMACCENGLKNQWRTNQDRLRKEMANIENEFNCVQNEFGKACHG